MDLTSIPDKEFQEESRRRYREQEKARQAERTRLYLEAQAAEEARDKEFAERIGITYAQYEEVESYVREKVFREQ
jgi:hypothetical protein